MSTRRLVVWVTFLAVFAMAARISVDTDTWWHLRAGQWIVENRRVPQSDPFSYTRAGEPWQYPGWLVEVPLYVIYRAFGPGGLNLWTAAMVTLAFGFVWARMSGGVFLRAFVLILAAAASGVYWAARPYMVTFVFAAVFLWVLEKGRRTTACPERSRRDDGRPPDLSEVEGSVVGGRWSVSHIWLLPLLMLVWANSHGGFAVGFMIWGVYFFSALVHWLIGSSVHRFMGASGRWSAVSGRWSALSEVVALGVTGLAMLAAVCLNPSGPVMLLYPFKTVRIGALAAYIQEWQSPDFHQLQVQPFLWLLLLSLGALGASRRRISLEHFLLLAGFAYLGLTAGRNIALFALVAPIVITRHAAPLLRDASQRLGFQESAAAPARWQSRLNWILLGALILAAGVKVALVVPEEVNRKHFAETLPVEAVEFIRQNKPQGRLFNSYNWGGYLLWAAPEYPVFVDGRTDLYGDEIVGQWVQVVQAEEGWEGVLDEWGVNLVLVEPFRPVARELARAGWKELYRDEVAVVYGR